LVCLHEAFFGNLADKENIVFKKTLTMTALTGVLVFAAGSALAADQDRTRQQDQTKDQIQGSAQDRIYGSQLMTAQERQEFRSRMRSAKTTREREQIRAEHHERMKVRAKERGVTIPDEPPVRGGGMGPGSGMGPGGGMGPRSGMGPGSGKQ
jgi:hypothetical protein